MAIQVGPFSWGNYYIKTEDVQISGRRVGSGDNLFANLRLLSPVATGGVPVGAGFFHQATRPSPKAPTGATDRTAFALDFRPQLDQDTNRHLEAVRDAATMGTVGVFLPVAKKESFVIPLGRTQWTLSCDITGSADVWPAFYRDPIVEIRSRTSGEAGLFESALTFVASSPSSVEFTLPNTTDNQPALFTGDLDAQVGKMLIIWAWVICEVEVLEMEEGFIAPGQWGLTLSLRLAPSPRDYEAD